MPPPPFLQTSTTSCPVLLPFPNPPSSSKPLSEPDKDAISTAVNGLIDSKCSYTNNNGGIIIDGKKWEGPMAKSQKKNVEKETKRKAAEADAAGGGGCRGDGGSGGGGEMYTVNKGKNSHAIETCITMYYLYT